MRIQGTGGVPDRFPFLTCCDREMGAEVFKFAAADPRETVRLNHTVRVTEEYRVNAVAGEFLEDDWVV